MRPQDVATIDAVLPQTQCTRCGFDGCRPYAEALARQTTTINRCPPGGTALIEQLAAMTGQPILPLDPACGVETPRRVARIDEARCIGCTLCIQACPVDAIVGAAKRMHTVVAQWCSGCDLCLPACPVDCIEMVPPPTHAISWVEPEKSAARQRHEARNHRLAIERTNREMRLAARARLANPENWTSAAKQDAIVAARLRARAKRAVNTQ
jgi:Na+-translocating ferredoxin:NAD+ oxidoreductase subunit B